MTNQQEQDSPNLLLDKEWERQQIRTFTSWINFQLTKAHLSIKDISTDLRDGKILTRLLEIISGESLPPTEKKNLRVHQVNNVNRCLEFIAKKGVRLAGIGSEEIVDGNLKMTLGCIWVIILRFVIQSCDELGKHDGLLLWCKKKTAGYPKVDVKNFTSSWSDGLAFNALIHKHRPELFRYEDVKDTDPITSLNHAFGVAEQHLGIPRMLDANDIKNNPDSKSIMTYVSAFYHEFSKTNQFDNAARKINRVLETNLENAKKMEDYEQIASDLLQWINDKIEDMSQLPEESDKLDKLLDRVNGVNKYRQSEKPPKAKSKAELENLLNSIKTRLFLQKRPEFIPRTGHSVKDIDEAWNKLNNHEKILLDRLQIMIQRLRHINDLLTKFYNKCDQQDKWIKGKSDPLQINVELLTLDKLVFTKSIVFALKNECESRKNRFNVITSLRDKLQELNCSEMPEVQQRYDGCAGSYHKLIQEIEEFSKKLKEREDILVQLDNLKQEYSKKASEVKAALEDGLEDMSDTYRVSTIAEAESLQKELKVFENSLPQIESKLRECESIQAEIAISVDPTNLYCSIQCNELKDLMSDVKKSLSEREGTLQNEKDNQVRNETICKEFAALAEEIQTFRNTCLEKISNAPDNSPTLEHHLNILKSIAEEIDRFYRERTPTLEDFSKKMQEFQIFHNSLTAHTVESINSDYQSLFDLIAASINEVENQIVVRDSSSITEQQIKDYRKSFDYFDKSKVNFLAGDDFVNFLVSLDFDVAKDDSNSTRELEVIKSKCDPEHTGRVTFNNFMNFVAAEAKDTDTAESIIESFRVLSEGRDYVTEAQIKRYLPDKSDNIISRMSPYTGPNAPAGALDFKSFASALYGESEL